jgi:hypothetical protein
MDSISQMSGLSARRKAIKRLTKNILQVVQLFKRGMFFVLWVALITAMSSCDKKSNEQTAEQNEKVSKDSLYKPDVNIKVNRRYDDKGNLIGFDSTYSSFYSNVQGDTARMDSMMHSFDRYFNLNHSSLFDRQFNRLFFNDTMRYPDFFHDDFFMKRYELNDEYLRGTMRRMDSVKNHFFREHSEETEEKSR